jgi:glucosamine--fructose-6-phosphate aminotransferase (isomerizing)
MPADKLEGLGARALRLVTGTYGLAVLDARGRNRSWSRATAALSCSASASARCSSLSIRARSCGHTQSVVHLDDGEIAVVRADGFETSTLDGGPTAKTPSTIAWTDESFDKSGYTHYMRKEIAEQPEAIRRTLSGASTALPDDASRRRRDGARELLEIRRVKILGCGSAYIAGCTARISSSSSHAFPRTPSRLGVSLSQSRRSSRTRSTSR